MAKYIFVTGGVVSGLGKGLTAASLGRILKQRGLKVFMQKLDPYINVDPGTMSPYQHGEAVAEHVQVRVFVVGVDACLHPAEEQESSAVPFPEIRLRRFQQEV